MELTFSLPQSISRFFTRIASKYSPVTWVILLSTVFAIIATYVSFQYDLIVNYGDAESHLNISKRVMHSLTPGMAQLGGIWLPLHHMMMMPFVYFDWLWRTGLGGSIVSGISYVVSSVYIYKLTTLLSKRKSAGFVAFLLFALNPNVLYMQSTPMSELPLIVFFMLSSYYFVLYLSKPRRETDSLLEVDDIRNLVLAALFSFCATLSRYDGWLLVMAQAAFIGIIHFPWKNWKTYSAWKELEGKMVMFVSLGFLGILLWLLWDWLILGDPLYFTNSQFSAKSQQQGWLGKGQLPTYHDLGLSIIYYTVNAMATVGSVIWFLFIAGVVQFIKSNVKSLVHWLMLGILFVPFAFYVITMFLGQSIIFIPHLTPTTFESTLFNVRYGLMMVPAVAIILGWYFVNAGTSNYRKVILTSLFLLQAGLFMSGYARVITVDDGVYGLSAGQRLDAEFWMHENYDGGLVLMDDYSRLISVIRGGIPLENVIYVGNKPYWEESLQEPEKYADWVVVQKDDAIWNAIYAPPDMQGRLFAHFTKVYTSEEILIFKRSSLINETDKVAYETITTNE